MGSLQAIEMAGLADLETALKWHLQSNHYPPIPRYMVPVAMDAIRSADADDWDAEIRLPDDVKWRGQNHAPVYAIVEHMHLDAFIGREV